MQNSALKLSALAGVVGIGFLVVLQTQRGLFQQTESDPKAVLESFTEDDEESTLLTAEDMGKNSPSLGESTDDIFSIQEEPSSDSTTTSGSNSTQISTSTPVSAESSAFDKPPLEFSAKENPIPSRTSDSKLVNSRGLDFRKVMSTPLAAEQEQDPLEGFTEKKNLEPDENPFSTIPEQPFKTAEGPATSVATADAKVSNADAPVESNAEPAFDPFEESSIPQSELANAKTQPEIAEPKLLDFGNEEPRPILFVESPDIAKKNSEPKIVPTAGEEPTKKEDSDELISLPPLPAEFESSEPPKLLFSDETPENSNKTDPFGTSLTPEPTIDSPKLKSVPEENPLDEAGQPALDLDSNPFGKQPEPGLFPENTPTTSAVEPAGKKVIQPVEANPFSAEPIPEVESQPAPQKSTPFDPFKRDPLTPAKNEPITQSEKAKPLPLPVTESSESLQPTPANNQPVLIDPSASPLDPVKDLLPEKPADEPITVAQPASTQRPELTIEKTAPKNAFLGRPLIYSILIKNVGKTAARQVMVEDRIPKGSKLTGTIPQAELSGNRLVWRIGTLKPNEQKKISVRVVPTSEGEIGSIATVNFVAEVAAKTTITAPKLELELFAPPQAKVGESIQVRFKIQNVGSGKAKDVWIRNLIPEQLVHPGGNDIEYEIGAIEPGQSKEIELTLTAAKAGLAVNQATVTNGDVVFAKTDSEIKITTTQLSISRTGPKKRFVGRTAEFTNVVTNDAKTLVNDFTVIETIPAGMEFVKVSAEGQYNEASQTIAWPVKQLGPGEKMSFTVTFRTKSIGQQTSQVSIILETKNIAEVQSVTDVVGITALAIDVAEIDGAAAVGEQFSVRLRLRNRGTKSARNVSAKIILPPELKFISAQGPVKYTQQAGVIQFESIDKIASKREAVIDVELVGLKVGDPRLQVQLDSDDLSRPLSHEEAIIIFDDSQ